MGGGGGSPVCVVIQTPLCTYYHIKKKNSHLHPICNTQLLRFETRGPTIISGFRINQKLVSLKFAILLTNLIVSWVFSSSINPGSIQPELDVPFPHLLSLFFFLGQQTPLKDDGECSKVAKMKEIISRTQMRFLFGSADIMTISACILTARVHRLVNSMFD